MAPQILRLKSLYGALVFGVLVSLATGLVENGPKIGIPEYKRYGYPLVWRVTTLNGPTEFMLTSLAIDAASWIIVSLFALIVLEKTVVPKLGTSVSYKKLLLPLVLFIPLGLAMDFAHEFGHAIWGTAVGGRLTYMKIAYFEIYPQFALTPEFALGYVRVEGLPTDFAYGLFLLGGSLTTNIVAWLLAIILLKRSFGRKTQVTLRVLGLFGILDLPFYVLFPQIGLRHWIFLGGYGPEPLMGAKKMGIPDPAFYITISFTTLGLAFLYFKPFWERFWKRIKLQLE